MAQALQHRQAALFARIPTAGATDDEPVPDTARSGRANAIVSLSRWYKKAVRPIGLEQWPVGQSTPRRHARNSANTDQAACSVTAPDLIGTGYGAKLGPYAGRSSHVPDGIAAHSEAFAISHDCCRYTFGHVTWTDVVTL